MNVSSGILKTIYSAWGLQIAELIEHRWQKQDPLYWAWDREKKYFWSARVQFSLRSFRVTSSLLVCSKHGLLVAVNARWNSRLKQRVQSGTHKYSNPAGSLITLYIICRERRVPKDHLWSQAKRKVRMTWDTEWTIRQDWPQSKKNKKQIKKPNNRNFFVVISLASLSMCRCRTSQPTFTHPASLIQGSVRELVYFLNFLYQIIVVRKLVLSQPFRPIHLISFPDRTLTLRLIIHQ